MVFEQNLSGKRSFGRGQGCLVLRGQRSTRHRVPGGYGRDAAAGPGRTRVQSLASRLFISAISAC